MIAPDREALGAARRLLRRRPELPEEVRERLALHFGLLYAWNARINLTALRDPHVGAVRLLEESLEALPCFPEPAGTLADLGSGNGYPGLALLCALPGWSGYLVESVERKAAFLSAAVREVGLGDRVRVLHQRIASPRDVPDRAGTVTMRGFPRPVDWIARLAAGEPPRRVVAWLGKADAVAAARRVGGSRRSRVIPLGEGRGVLLCVERLRG
ncbi:MAG: 16S rRNA (guanine(527)-N(7))-methyltransferase RsmG [Acidobacteria bacterium]|nr:MAG: 16S rRNA (guanine(527)-N(7))-methyltransferase RsmG [Acidobacteriota bacterium]